MNTSSLAGTRWIAHPEAYDYLHHVAFDLTRGFVLQGDGQALKWASFFDYEFDGGQLNIHFRPTSGDVGNEQDYETYINAYRTTGEFKLHFEMGGLRSFDETLTLSSPIVPYEPDSLLYYRVPLNRSFQELTNGYALVH